MSVLVPCLACNRHVRSGDACPFCGARSAESSASPLARTSRAALFAIATAACGAPSQVQPYGQPPLPPASEDASTPAATATTTASTPAPPTSNTATVAAYGAAPAPTVAPPQPKH